MANIQTYIQTYAHTQGAFVGTEALQSPAPSSPCSLTHHRLSPKLITKKIMIKNKG